MSYLGCGKESSLVWDKPKPTSIYYEKKMKYFYRKKVMKVICNNIQMIKNSLHKEWTQRANKIIK